MTDRILHDRRTSNAWARALGAALASACLWAWGCTNGPGSIGADTASTDIGAPHLGDGAPPDGARILDQDMPGLDAGSVADAGPRDATPLDTGRIDGQPPVDAIVDAIADAGAPDLYPFTPDPICAELTPLEVDMPGSFERVPSVPGILWHVIDTDGDGRVELFVLTERLPPPVDPTVSLIRTRYAWHPEEGFVERGRVLGHLPMAALTLESGRRVLAGRRHFVNEARILTTTLALHGDRVGDEWIYNDVLALFTHVDARGFTQPDYSRLVALRVIDGDGDGRPEVLTNTGDLLETRGDGIERVWRVIEADPRDEAREIGGYAAGHMAVGDFDGDGRMEFVLDGWGPEGPIGDPGFVDIWRMARVFENVGDDAYHLVTRLPFGANNAQFGAEGDIDGDGVPEFLYGGSASNCLRFEVWKGVADDTYARIGRVDYATSRGGVTTGGAAAFGDLDGDGDDELVLAVGDAVTAWDLVDGELVQIMGYPFCRTCDWGGVQTGDLEGDGIDEIFFVEISREEVRDGVVLSPNGVRILRYRPPQ